MAALFVTVGWGPARLYMATPGPWLPDAGRAYGPCQAASSAGTRNPLYPTMPPTEVGLLRPCSGQSGRWLAGTVGHRVGNALTLVFCRNPTCHFCVGCSSGE